MTPSLSGHGFTVERDMAQPPARLYRAWTEGFDQWFAAPGTVRMRAEVDTPFYFETDFQSKRHPHYGRFLRLVPDRLVEMSWVTGAGGTEGAETVVAVAFEPNGAGTHVRLEHKGFASEASARQHEEAWPVVLREQEKRLMEADRGQA
jgi:uncharacterized protein YndB with AHSA1/START domain